MPALNRRKRRQLERFLPNRTVNNEGRFLKLQARARSKGNLIQENVLRLFVQGKPSVLKISNGKEIVSRSNLASLFRAHRDAIAGGLIPLPRTYVWEKTRYRYASNSTSLTERHEGIGLESLSLFLKLARIFAPANESEEIEFMRKYSQISRNSFMGLRRFMGGEQIIENSPRESFRALKEFVTKNPQITENSLSTLKMELSNNLSSTTQSRQGVTYDLIGKDNVIVKGADKKTGKIRIGIVDQVPPGAQERARSHLAELKAKKISKK